MELHANIIFSLGHAPSSAMLDLSTKDSMLKGNPQNFRYLWTENYNLGVVRKIIWSQMQLVQERLKDVLLSF